MGQEERARALVEEKLEFSGATPLAPDQAIAAARVAAQPYNSKLNASIQEVGSAEDDGEHLLMLEVRGPGRVLTLMTFSVHATPREDGGSDIALEVEDFTFQKGSFGMSPQVPANGLVTKYVRTLRQALAR